MMRRGIATFWAAAVGVILPATCFAHERWFVSDTGIVPPFFRSFGWHIPIAAGVILVALLLSRLADGWFRRMQFGRRAALDLARFASWVPLLVGWGTAAVLIQAALHRTLLAPHLILPDTATGTALVIVELAVAALLILGLFARPAAAALIVLAVWSFAQFGVPAIENVFFLGVGFFLFVWGRGRLALGAVFSRIVFAMDTAHMKPTAVSVLRIVTGVALLLGGIDKLWHPGLHLALLAAYPDWNPLVIVRSVWPALSQNMYVFQVAATEIGLALLVMTGWLLRPVALWMAVTFVGSLLFLPGSELIGHGPYIAVFLGLTLLGRSVERVDRL